MDNAIFNHAENLIHKTYIDQAMQARSSQNLLIKELFEKVSILYILFIYPQFCT